MSIMRTTLSSMLNLVSCITLERYDDFCCFFLFLFFFLVSNCQVAYVVDGILDKNKDTIKDGQKKLLKMTEK